MEAVNELEGKRKKPVPPGCEFVHSFIGRRYSKSHDEKARRFLAKLNLVTNGQQGTYS